MLYDWLMARSGETQELWDRLDYESERAYEGFKCYLYLGAGSRSNMLEVYRLYTDNPQARSVSTHFYDWADENAWEDRARAYDRHLEQLRRRGAEKAIEKEAEKGAREAERVRNRMNELMSLAAEKGIEWLQSEEYSRKDFKAADVINIIKLHVEYQSKVSGAESTPGANGSSGDDWSEEDDAEFASEVLDRVRSGDSGEDPAGDDPGEEEEGI